jgi:POT family proton-dependent oligopeptide transporter
VTAASGGYQRGLAILCFTQMWERFSFYGMRALLILYLTEQLLLPGRVEHVMGYPQLAGTLAWMFGPLSVQAISSQIYGLYGALTFLTPLLGGLIGARMGTHRAVFLGGAMIAFGHLLMAFEPTFLFALLAIILGSGLFTPNISAQVGMLYAPEDARRERGYSLFYVGINVGAFLAPLVCGTIGEIYGWHYGFSLAAIGMTAGLVIYGFNMRHLPDRPMTAAASDVATRAPTPLRTIALVAAVMASCVFFWAAYEQIGNAIVLWLRDASDLAVTDGFALKVTWFQAVNPLVILLGTPALLAFWTWQSSRGCEPSPAAKMAIGGVLFTCAFVLFASVAAMTPTGERAHWGWTILAIALMTLGELHIAPISWSLFSRIAPAGREGFFMGLWLLPLFAGSYLAGLIGAHWEEMTHARYFVLVGSVAATAAFGFILLSLMQRRRPIG